MDLKLIVGHMATVFTIGVFLAGFETCRKIWLKKSTDNLSAMPFLCGLMSCSLWLRYGFSINDTPLMIVNLTGCGLQIFYIVWYFKFTLHKDVFFKQLSVTLLLIGFFYCYTSFFTACEQASFISGIAACIAGVIFMASPLTAVAYVIKTKNTDTLPFLMILCTFIMASIWFLYGLLVDDKFVQVPNLLGALLALAQLCLFAIYPSERMFCKLGGEIV